jgi:hypothetical protein
MATKIRDSGISSDLTRHIARGDGSGDWSVSRLPGRTLTHSQAITTEAGASAETAAAARRTLRPQNDGLRPFYVRSRATSPNGLAIRGEAAGQRRAWDSNPRCRSPDTVVFKTTAIGH